MTAISHYLRIEYAGLELHEILIRPTDVLLGVTANAANALKEVGIETVFDLGSSWLFANARAAAEAGGLSSMSGRLGLAPSDWLKPLSSFKTLDAIGQLPLDNLNGLTESQANALKAALDISTIRDFAYWPPRSVAHKLVGDAVGTTDPEEQHTETLRPRLGEYPTERVYYDTLTMLQMSDSAALERLQAPISLSPAVNQPIGFDKPAVGALLTYSQSWYAKGVTLGHMLHSLALAPGEATRIAVIDWSRRTSATATESVTESEQLDNATQHARAISEVQNAVATELQHGGSMASGWASSHSEAEAGGGGSGMIQSALFGGGSSSYSSQDAFTESFAASASWSLGTRSVTANMTQNVNDRTEQHANSVRNRRASAVREVSQSEHEQVSTRIVANYNHMHALTVQYYEVVQVYQVSSQLHTAVRCLFVPFELIDFGAPNAMDVVQRFRGALVRGALTLGVRDLLIDDVTRVAIRPSVKVRIPGRDVAADIPPAAALTVSRQNPTPEPIAEGGQPAPPALPRSNPVWDRDQILRVSRMLGCSLLRPGSDALYLPDDTELLGLSFNRLSISSVRLDRAGTTAADNTLSVPINSAYVDLPTGVHLFELDAISVAKTGEPAAVGTMVLHCALRGRPFTTPSIAVELGLGSAMQKVVSLQTDEVSRQRELLAHLQANRAHYSQAVFRSLDSATIVMLLSPFTWNGKALVDQVEPTPLSVAGNFLVLRAPVEPDESSGIVEDGNVLDWGTVLRQRGIDFTKADARLVPVPTDGVFAEAVLGRSNAAEKLDITRFWNWQDSPIPLQPPEISPVGTGSRGTPEDLRPGTVSAPVLNIVNPTSLPDPAGLSASLGVLASANLFRDMSGLQGTQSLSESGLRETLAAASQAGQLATTNLQTEAQRAVAMGQIAGDIAKAAMGIPAKDSSTNGISADGARINHARDMDSRIGATGAPSGESMPISPNGPTPDTGGRGGGGGGGGGGRSPNVGGAGEEMSTSTFSREQAYSDQAALGYSPSAVGATALLLPAALSTPGLPIICEELRQKRQQWETVRQAIVDVAQDEYENTWNKGNRIESDPAMLPVLQEYWQEPAYHGKPLPGWVNIPGSAWSAVFIAWIVNKAGGGDFFSKVHNEPTYRPKFVPMAHWRYLAPALINTKIFSTVNPFWAHPIGALIPEMGDIIVRSRGNPRASWSNFEGFETHGDIIVDVDYTAGTYSVLGGNKSSPACAGPNDGCTVNRRDGYLLDSNGFVDPSFGANDKWFALIRINTSIFQDSRCETVSPSAGSEAPVRV
ncbi:DUF2272 domain-containing protein [Variovorax paradoxus]|nr:DUF2272 domain-containing protein [Variovorax paradoxus]MBT2305007.1 DUF2272 domain-containing protein [Variovorax paradoxus]